MSNILRHGPSNSITCDLAGRSIGSVLSDRNLQVALGFGTNVQARIYGRVVSSEHVISSGETVEVETVANRKANTVNITLRYGTANALTRGVNAGTTVKQVLTNQSFRAALGFGDNVIAKINGAAVRDDLYVTDGLVIDLETAANQKAS